MPEVNGAKDSKVALGLLQACLDRFDALVAEGEVCFDAGTTTIVPVNDAFKVSFRLCPTLLSKPVIVASPTTSPFHDPLAARSHNPFEDPDPRYVVECPVLKQPNRNGSGNAMPTHRLLINKFPVYRPQVLVTTIATKSQADDLDIYDLRAGLDVLRELERVPSHENANGAKARKAEFLGIYNCGAHSGNSQSHKHLQLFPKPEADEIVLFPEREGSIERRRTIQHGASQNNAASVYSDPDIPFVHFFSFHTSETGSLLDEGDDHAIPDAMAALITYTTLLDHAKRALSLAGVTSRPSHNLIFTRRWMLVVPRRAACGDGTGTFWQGPQVNAAGIAGLVWMSNEREFEEWKRRGVAKHLGQCGLRWAELEGTELGL